MLILFILCQSISHSPSLPFHHSMILPFSLPLPTHPSPTFSLRSIPVFQWLAVWGVWPAGEPVDEPVGRKGVLRSQVFRRLRGEQPCPPALPADGTPSSRQTGHHHPRRSRWWQHNTNTWTLETTQYRFLFTKCFSLVPIFKQSPNPYWEAYPYYWKGKIKKTLARTGLWDWSLTRRQL